MFGLFDKARDVVGLQIEQGWDRALLLGGILLSLSDKARYSQLKEAADKEWSTIHVKGVTDENQQN